MKKNSTIDENKDKLWVEIPGKPGLFMVEKEINEESGPLPDITELKKKYEEILKRLESDSANASK